MVMKVVIKELSERKKRKYRCASCYTKKADASIYISKEIKTHLCDNCLVGFFKEMAQEDNKND